MRDWLKHTTRTLYSEIWGKDIDHPVVRRVLAYIVDFILYGVLGGLVTFILYRTNKYDYESQLWITMGLTTIYFTLGASKYFKGQTFGKRFFKIRVVDEQGNFIGLWRAFLRSVPIVLLTNSLSILLTAKVYYEVSDSIFVTIYSILLSFFIGVFYFGTVKLNRQCLHDLVVSTQVTETTSGIKTEKHLNPLILAGYIILTGTIVMTVINN